MTDTQAAWEAVTRRVETLGMMTLAVGYGPAEVGVGGGWWHQPENRAWGIFHGGWVHDCEEDDDAFDPIKEGPMVPVSVESDGRTVKRVVVEQAECLCGARLLSLVEESEQDGDAIQGEQDRAWAEELIAEVAGDAAQRQFELDGGV
ncbi:MAG: hypothetical protein ACYCZN_01835 [Candidatus Dormibacteria bacterium]